MLLLVLCWPLLFQAVIKGVLSPSSVGASCTFLALGKGNHIPPFSACPSLPVLLCLFQPSPGHTGCSTGGSSLCLAAPQLPHVLLPPQHKALVQLPAPRHSWREGDNSCCQDKLLHKCPEHFLLKRELVPAPHWGWCGPKECLLRAKV